MTTLALYYPKPEAFVEVMVLLILFYVGLCGLAFRLKLNIFIAALSIAVGGVAGLAYEIYSAVYVTPGSHDLARQMTKTNYSDSFFEFTSQMTVGYGRMEAVAGMVIGLLLYAYRATISRRRRHSAFPKRDEQSTLNSPLDALHS